MRQRFAEAFGPGFQIRAGRYLTAEKARSFFARIKEVPIYILGTHVHSGLLSELAEVVPAWDLVTDQEMLWVYCEDISQTCGLGDDSPGIRLRKDFVGPQPWTDPGESPWYRARGDQRPATAAPGYSANPDLLGEIG